MDRPYADKACELMEIAGANKNSVTVLNAVIEECQVRMSVVNDLLDAAKEQSFEWPTTDAPAARHGFDGDFFFYEHGLLSYLGYHVGGSGKTKSVRQQLLDCVFLRRVFGVKYFCRSTSTILAGSDGCSFDVAPFAGRCCGVLKTQKTKRRERPLGDVHGVR